MSIRRLWSQFLSLFKKSALDRDFDDEARSHIALATDDYLQRGMPLAEAQRLARTRFGSIEASKDAHRDSRGLPTVEGLLYDLRIALRGLRREWGFTLTAIATLTLAVALNVIVFTIMNAMVYRGLPQAKQSDRLGYIVVRRESGPWNIWYTDFQAWRSQSRSFEDLAFTTDGPITFRDGDGRSIDMNMRQVTANTFGLLGVKPILGRDFVKADEAPGADPVAILSYRFWESRFAKRQDILGVTVHINDKAATIIGVMPEDFTLVSEQNLWAALKDIPAIREQGFGSSFGRLRETATRETAQSEIQTVNNQLQAADPKADRQTAPLVLSYSEAVVGPEASVIYGSLWIGSCFVLLIACANMANLSLMRTVGRAREFSTRIALGAGQVRMIRQIVVEGLLLACLSGALAWWITNWAVRAWATATASRYLVLDYTVDAGILTYLATISVGAALLFSVAPIVCVTRLGLSGVLKANGRGITLGDRGRRLASTLVIVQMALAIVLLSGAGILVRSLNTIIGADTGVLNPENILVGFLKMPSDTYPTPASRLAYLNGIDTQLRSIPGVEAAAIATSIPVNSGSLRAFETEGRPSLPNDGRLAQAFSVGPSYFRVLGRSAVSGRDFDEHDQTETLPVAIVNESFVSTFWPNEQPIGKRLRFNNRNQVGVWRTVVGVVPNIMQGDPVRQTFKPLVYVPFSQDPATAGINSAGCCFRGANFLVRTTLPPDFVAQAVRAAMQGPDPSVDLEDFGALNTTFGFDRGRMDLEHAELGKYAAVAPVFALIAMLLAAIGLYAVIAHSVTQRTNEIGIRMAIGAAANDIGRMVLRRGLLPVVAGLLVGLAASFAVNRILQSQLVGISPYDPVSIAGAPIVLVLVASIAAYIPARRAMKVDPVVALRHD